MQRQDSAGEQRYILRPKQCVAGGKDTLKDPTHVSRVFCRIYGVFNLWEICCKLLLLLNPVKL